MAESSERRCFFSLELKADLVWQFFMVSSAKLFQMRGRLAKGKRSVEESLVGGICRSWSFLKGLSSGLLSALTIHRLLKEIGNSLMVYLCIS